MSDGELLLGATYVVSLAGAILALPTTLLLLRLYRRSILRLMNTRGTEDGTSPAFAVISTPARPAVAPTDADVANGVRRNATVVVVVALLSAFGYALLLLLANDIDLSIYRLAYFTVVYSWPGVIGIWIVTLGRRRWVLGSTAIYFACLLTAGFVGGGTLAMTLGPWLAAVLPTAAVLAFLTRPLRGVGPIVLGAMMIGIVGAQVTMSIVIGSVTLRELWVDLWFAIGITNAVFMFWGLYLAGFLLAFVIALPVVRILAAWYSRGGFSDQMLLLGAVFLVFAIDQSLAANPSSGTVFAIGMGIYVVAGAISLLIYRLIHKRRRPPANLLLLRVFASNRSHQRLLDLVTGRWRHVGPVRLIGAPDLAVATVEPDEFLSFVAGKLHRLFVDSAAVLEERLAALRPRTDRDGRYRVDEFFCFDNTWRQSVARLLGGSDAVLMDLRGLSAANDGALAELRMLADSDAMSRTILVVDSSTDHDILDGELSRSPGGAQPTVVDVTDDAKPDRVLAACVQAAAGAGLSDVV